MAEEDNVPLPLSECLLTAFFRPAEFLELPTSKLVAAWPDWTLSAISDELNFVRLAEQFAGGTPNPLYRLEQDPTEKSALILFGMNSISYNSPGPSYPGWAKYRDNALSVLKKASEIFGQGESLQPLSFRYVDVFEADDFDGLARKFAPISEDRDYSAGFEPLYKVVLASATINGRESRIMRSAELFYPKDADRKLRLVVEFNIEADLPRPTAGQKNAMIEGWLNAAHRVHKKLLWDALTDSYRADVQAGLFDDAEIAEFEILPYGFSELVG